ncbi:AraC family transcriptional regulator [Nonomuraea gerenzanensis]|uniref:Transcriptional regulator, AraC family n=1 Tax=Nonomuraea gerenzanensis TaxID=93944 RepID=A0A1M4E5R2_9ACTN|nr:AraC family transcriptional regulator [Nonomuraea gerenzanensis]UBU16372.1 AraC family transcriptional regulator [Nonomuraea gerenzanensis]SBO94191.1 Transcriptional regulator, AraC family [Nonomuraea gerenzanensis]
MKGDLLSALLAPLRLEGVFHSRWQAGAPWGIAGEGEDCALLHYVHDGTCAVELPGAEPVLLRAGDLAVFPHGSAHRLGDRPGRPTVPLASVLPERPPGGMSTVELGGPGERTVLLCGGLHYDRAAVSPLYRVLPPVLVLDQAALEGHGLLRDVLGRLANEWHLAEGGATLVTLRAFELVFVLALRAAVGELAEGSAILRALHHPAIGTALHVVQTRFAEPWTVESLAAQAGLSRSAFASTFRELVGEAPMRHLTARRMQEAARLLSDTGLSHSRISERVGYESTVGFHLAFRKWYGVTPGDYRRRWSQTLRGTAPMRKEAGQLSGPND